MNRCFSSKIWVLVILVIFIVGGILAWQYFEIEKIEKKKTKVSEETVKDETSNWRTYKNEEYGIAIEYPDNWKIKRESIDEFDKSISVSFFPLKKNLRMLTLLSQSLMSPFFIL